VNGNRRRWALGGLLAILVFVALAAVDSIVMDPVELEVQYEDGARFVTFGALDESAEAALVLQNDTADAAVLFAQNYDLEPSVFGTGQIQIIQEGERFQVGSHTYGLKQIDQPAGTVEVYTYAD